MDWHLKLKRTGDVVQGTSDRGPGIIGRYFGRKSQISTGKTLGMITKFMGKSGEEWRTRWPCGTHRQIMSRCGAAWEPLQYTRNGCATFNVYRLHALEPYCCRFCRS